MSLETCAQVWSFIPLWHAYIREEFHLITHSPSPHVLGCYDQAPSYKEDFRDLETRLMTSQGTGKFSTESGWETNTRGSCRGTQWDFQAKGTLAVGQLFPSKLWVTLKVDISSPWPMKHSVFVSSPHMGWFIDSLDLKVLRLLVPKGNSLQCRSQCSDSLVFPQCWRTLLSLAICHFSGHKLESCHSK